MVDLEKACDLFPGLLWVFFFVFGIIFSHQVPVALPFSLLMLFSIGLNCFWLKPLAQWAWNRWRLLERIFGPGERPHKSKYCGKQYGMPSGHAQTVFSVAVFWSLYLLCTGQLHYSLFLTCLLFLMALIVSYSRVVYGCHTIQQVMVGAILGILIGQLEFLSLKFLI